MDEIRNIPFSLPDITDGEINAVAEVLKSGWITTGYRTKEFEKRIATYCGVEKAVCLNSATACLEGILRILGIGESDEVITSAYTYTASASPVCHIGAQLVLVDTAKDSFQMDYAALENAITEKTKVIIPVDIGGVLCDYEKIFDIAERKKHLFHPSNDIQKAIGRIIIVADSAHALGASKAGKMAGNVADFTSVSFHAVKNLTTAEGGTLTWKHIAGVDDDELYKKFMLYSLHGQSKDALAKTQLGAWEYDIVSTDYKCNMTDIMASIGLVQLDRYKKLLARRKEIIESYDAVCNKLGVYRLVHFDEGNVSSGHLYLATIPGIHNKKRNEIINYMAEKGVGTNVHYKPLPMMTAYKTMGFDIKDYPNAYRQYENEISLPLHTRLSDEDVGYVMDIFETAVKEVADI